MPRANAGRPATSDPAIGARRNAPAGSCRRTRNVAARRRQRSAVFRRNSAPTGAIRNVAAPGGSRCWWTRPRASCAIGGAPSGRRSSWRRTLNVATATDKILGTALIRGRWQAAPGPPHGHPALDLGPFHGPSRPYGTAIEPWSGCEAPTHSGSRRRARTWRRCSRSRSRCASGRKIVGGQATTSPSATAVGAGWGPRPRASLRNGGCPAMMQRPQCCGSYRRDPAISSSLRCA